MAERTQERDQDVEVDQIPAVSDWDLRTWRVEKESEFIRQCLKAHNWRRQVTANALGLTREGLYKLINRYDIKEIE